MRSTLVILGFISQAALAFENTVCISSTQTEALISTHVSDTGCTLDYRFNGKDTVLWTSSDQASCENKAKAMLMMHRDRWGWECVPAAEYYPTVDTHVIEESLDPVVRKEINEYQQAAMLGAAIAAASSIRMMMREYYMRNGEWPKTLEDIYLTRADMQDSRAISDLAIGENGAIYMLGNEKLGKDMVIRLQEKSVLGGTSTELECKVNREMKRVDYCDYDWTITFPL